LVCDVGGAQIGRDETGIAVTGWDALDGPPRRPERREYFVVKLRDHRRVLPQGLEMTDEDAARVGRELDAGHPAVGVLTWDFETEEVAETASTSASPH
jgi:hypothetical protein